MDFIKAQKIDLGPSQELRTQTLSALAAGAAHEASNALAAAVMSVDLLETAVPKEQGWIVSALRESARQGLDVLRQLLALARAADHEGTVFQPRYLITHLQLVIRRSLPRDIDLVTDYPPDLWSLTGDPAVLYQWLLDFCLDATDRLAGGGTLTVRARNEAAGSDLPEGRPTEACVLVEIETRSAALRSGRTVEPGAAEPDEALHSASLRALLGSFGGAAEILRPESGMAVVRAYLPTAALKRILPGAPGGALPDQL